MAERIKTAAGRNDCGREEHASGRDLSGPGCPAKICGGAERSPQRYSISRLPL